MKKFVIRPSAFKVEFFINEDNKYEAFLGHTCGTGWELEGDTKEEVAEKVKQFIINYCTFEE